MPPNCSRISRYIRCLCPHTTCRKQKRGGRAFFFGAWPSRCGDSQNRDRKTPYEDQDMKAVPPFESATEEQKKFSKVSSLLNWLCTTVITKTFDRERARERGERRREKEREGERRRERRGREREREREREKERKSARGRERERGRGREREGEREGVRESQHYSYC